ASTVTPGSTPPDASFTCPAIAPCAKAAVGRKSRARTTTPLVRTRMLGLRDVSPIPKLQKSDKRAAHHRKLPYHCQSNDRGPYANSRGSYRRDNGFLERPARNGSSASVRRAAETDGSPSRRRRRTPRVRHEETRTREARLRSSATPSAR